MSSYFIGTLVRLSCSFSDTTGAAVDPVSVVLKIKTPDGTVAIPTPVIKDAVGQYHYDYAITQSGQHYYRFEGTGVAQGATERDFFVPASLVA